MVLEKKKKEKKKSCKSRWINKTKKKNQMYRTVRAKYETVNCSYSSNSKSSCQKLIGNQMHMQEFTAGFEKSIRYFFCCCCFIKCKITYEYEHTQKCIYIVWIRGLRDHFEMHTFLGKSNKYKKHCIQLSVILKLNLNSW